MDKATLTCPECQAPTEKEMPQNQSEVMYDCAGCGKQIKAKEGMCCVYCSHSDKRCENSVLNNNEDTQNAEPASAA